ncbi:MAG: tetratricopeptide repeat protein [Gaiellaceae bacterium]
MSPRTRIRLVVGALALGAAAAAVGVALIGRGDGEGAKEPPPLELSVVIRNDAEARGLRAAERAYDGGDRAAARRQFDALLRAHPSSLEAAVGAAIAAWPERTLERLRGLATEHPASALVHLHLGLALYTEGRSAEAAAEWRLAQMREPDSSSAIRAGDLLHPDIAPGLPSFFSDLVPPKNLQTLSPQEQVDELERRAERGGADEWILYGTALQRIGRPLSAQAAFDRALMAAPDRLDAKVAAAVARFEKDNLSAAFSRLGPLARDNPRSALVRFHLGVLLLWIRDVKDARVQLRLAVRAEPAGLYSREGKALLSRLEEVRT